jgi:hypothetical protein
MLNRTFSRIFRGRRGKRQPFKVDMMVFLNRINRLKESNLTHLKLLRVAAAYTDRCKATSPFSSTLL